jgi:hypothetical protein
MRSLILVAIVLCILPLSASGQESDACAGDHAGAERLVAEYIELYSGPTLDRWRTLFHPSVLVAFPDRDGSVQVRNLDDFITRQKGYFATGRQISERLENVRIDMGCGIARVSADFIFVNEGDERRGKLGLHLAADRSGWRIVSVLFAYEGG